MVRRIAILGRAVAPVLPVLLATALTASPAPAGERPGPPHPQLPADLPDGRGADQAPPAAPGSDAHSVVPDNATLTASGAVIGEIIIRAADVFDPERPGENKAIYRAANHLHITTRDGVIRKQLTFKSGDRFDPLRLEESARILRKSGYMWDASIRPVAYHDGLVDVEVRTRDVWTLKAGAGFGRSGGVNKTSVGLHDSNFLGFGKDIEIERSSNTDRTSTAIEFTDRNVFGRKMRLDANYVSRSDGSLRGLTFERPFWAADDPWAWGVSGSRDQRTESLYALGHVTEQFGHVKTSYEVSGGIGRGTLGERIHHWRFGWTYEDDAFSALLDAPVGSTVPDGRRLSYPWIEYGSFRDSFVALKDLDKIGRTEDLNMGRSFHVRIGAAAPAFGSDRTAGVFEAGVERGYNPGNAQMLLLSGDATGRTEGSGIQNGLASGVIRYYLRDEGGRVFHMAFRASLASHLDPENQLLLGGDTGLRGYPLRYAQGTSMWLFTVEERWYGQREFFKLFRVGAAAFFDMGRVAGRGDLPGGDLDILRDAGVGLRFGQSRSAHAAMIHLDVAVPLDTRGTSIKRTQFLVTTGETF